MLVSIKEDLDELKRMYSDNKVQIALYEFVFHNNPGMVALITIDGKIISANSRALHELGYTIDEVDGSDIMQVIHPDDRDGFKRRLIKCVESPGTIISDDMRKIRKDGSMFWVHEQTVAEMLPDETLVILVTCENITHLKNMIESLENTNLALESANQELRAICDELKAQYPRR